MTVLAIRHVPKEGLGLLEEVFRQEAIPFRYLDAYAESFPSVDLSSFSGVVVLGGPMGVYETSKHPFLREEIKLLREVLRREIPTLGICLGSQLLAAAALARVYKGPRKEIGWFPIQMREAARKDPLLKACPAETLVFHWHGDTFDLPPGASHLASSDRYVHQAFRVGEKAWGFQFHFEVTEPMIRDWVEAEEAEEKNLKVQNPDFNACEILTQTPCFLPEMDALARNVFGAFARLAA
jgi:GMP synthase (glutamine-hydrolysing)